MNYYNLKIILMPKNEIKYENTYEKISKLISFAMLQDNELKIRHERNEYKRYVFCGLYPIEKDLIYKPSKIYTFDLRSLDLKFLLKMKQLITITNNADFKIIMSNIENNEQRLIKTLTTLTPAIITTTKGDYAINNDMELVRNRILANTQKKYESIFHEKNASDFINGIKQINMKPIKLPYKNIFLLGNKFEVTVKPDEESQKLAYINLAIGMLEKNAEGFGFCRAK